MSKTQKMIPEDAVNRLMLISTTLDELALQDSRAHEGEGGLSGTLMLLSQSTEECAMSLQRVVDANKELAGIASEAPH